MLDRPYPDCHTGGWRAMGFGYILFRSVSVRIGSLSHIHSGVCGCAIGRKVALTGKSLRAGKTNKNIS